MDDGLGGGVGVSNFQGDTLGFAGQKGEIVVAGESVGHGEAVVSQQKHLVEEGNLAGGVLQRYVKIEVFGIGPLA